MNAFVQVDILATVGGPGKVIVTGRDGGPQGAPVSRFLLLVIEDALSPKTTGLNKEHLFSCLGIFQVHWSLDIWRSVWGQATQLRVASLKDGTNLFCLGDASGESVECFVFLR